MQRGGLQKVIAYLDSRPDLFPRLQSKESRLLRREEKEAVRSTWQQFLDYLVGLDSIKRYRAKFHRLKGTAREDSFLDGQERKRNAVEASLTDFRSSWKRPKWHVITQK